MRPMPAVPGVVFRHPYGASYLLRTGEGEGAWTTTAPPDVQRFGRLLAAKFAEGRPGLRNPGNRALPVGLSPALRKKQQQGR